MRKIDITEAATSLADLAALVQGGERVVVTRDGEALFEIVAPRKGGIDWEAGEAWLKAQGIDRKEIWIAPDFDDPLPEDFLLKPLPEEK